MIRTNGNWDVSAMIVAMIVAMDWVNERSDGRRRISWQVGTGGDGRQVSMEHGKEAGTIDDATLV